MTAADPATGITWRELAAGLDPPPIDRSLAGWAIEKSRPSHLNARRMEDRRTLHLKWFFHGPIAAPARREWDGAKALAALGIPASLPLGWGVHPRGSFIVLEGSPGFPADAWRENGVTAERLDRLTAGLATLVSTLHDANLCHRDLNVYHVLVDGDSLRIIDVGRVRRFLRRRWIVKDLASLLASAVREGFPQRAARLFLSRYLSQTRRAWNRRRLLAKVTAKAERYRRHTEKKEKEEKAIPLRKPGSQERKRQ
jgi:tRNA A-37 threonylcarbamoyl transferase component Bud32